MNDELARIDGNPREMRRCFDRYVWLLQQMEWNKDAPIKSHNGIKGALEVEFGREMVREMLRTYACEGCDGVNRDLFGEAFEGVVVVMEIGVEVEMKSVGRGDLDLRSRVIGACFYAARWVAKVIRGC